MPGGPSAGDSTEFYQRYGMVHILSQSDLHAVTTYVFVVIMGVSGTGKTTLGKALSKTLCMPFVEGDELHPQSNLEKMSNGQALSDEDRQPWLELIRRTAVERTLGNQDAGEPQKKVQGVVITCSALKKSYRDILRGQEESVSTPSLMSKSQTTYRLQTCFVYIKGERDLIARRMEERKGHYFKASMLDSQFAVLESPEGEEGVVVVDNELSTDGQLMVAVEALKSILGDIANT